MKARFIITIMAICSHLLVLGQTYNYAYVDGYKIKYGSGYYTSSGQYVHNGTIEEMGCFQTICPPAEVKNYKNYPHILVKSIGDNAFEYCTATNEIIINDGIETIGKHAFYDCANASSIWLAQSIKLIRDEAFAFCMSLEKISCGADTPPSLGSKVFLNVDKSIPLYVPGWSISAYQSTDQWKDFHNIQPLVFSGNYGDSICWKFFTADSTFSVYGHGQIPRIYPYIPWFQWKNIISNIVISEGITTISQGTFFNFSSVKSITCYAITPPVLEVNSFYNIDRNIPIFVPSTSIIAYQNAEVWKEFNLIVPISAKTTETTDIITTATENSVNVKWPVVFGATSYELVIKENEDKVVSMLIFNSDGILNSAGFNTPSRDGAPQHTQVAGFAFTITGLEAGTFYNLTITAKNESGQEIDKKTAQFITMGGITTSLEDLYIDSDNPTKVLHNGQIYILRGNHIFNTQGKMVR